MKTKPEAKHLATLTEEQIKARKAAEAFFSDLLAKPQKTAKANGTSAPAPRNGKANGKATPDATKSEFYIAVERQYHIVTQECKTCSARHRYALTKLVRFRARGRKDNLHVEVPCLLHPALDIPARVVHSFETTDFCPQCLDLVLRLETVLPAEPDSAKQLSLFN